MELVDLLDLIDETTPKSCQTCRHAGTHARCRGCLGPEGHPAPEPFLYSNWEPGNALRDLQAAEIAGQRNIVIGGQGEADFCATTPPAEVARYLHRVADECGYLVGHLHRDADRNQVLIVITDKEHKVIWNAEGKLQRIENAETKEIEWPRF